jgi:hypothetical protein
MDCIVMDCIAFAVEVSWVFLLFLGVSNCDSKIGVFCDVVLPFSCGVALLRLEL